MVGSDSGTFPPRPRCPLRTWKTLMTLLLLPAHPISS